jgi:hypothetical protein
MPLEVVETVKIAPVVIEVTRGVNVSSLKHELRVNRLYQVINKVEVFVLAFCILLYGRGSIFFRDEGVP